MEVLIEMCVVAVTADMVSSLLAEAGEPFVVLVRTGLRGVLRIIPCGWSKPGSDILMTVDTSCP